MDKRAVLGFGALVLVILGLILLFPWWTRVTVDDFHYDWIHPLVDNSLIQESIDRPWEKGRTDLSTEAHWWSEVLAASRRWHQLSAKQGCYPYSIDRWSFMFEGNLTNHGSSGWVTLVGRFKGPDGLYEVQDRVHMERGERKEARLSIVGVMDDEDRMMSEWFQYGLTVQGRPVELTGS